MSKMRMSILAMLAVISFGLSGISAVSAAPANGSTIDAITPQAIETVYYYGYRHYGYRHCWWRYGRRICRW
jgi:hypothetical protein